MKINLTDFIGVLFIACIVAVISFSITKALIFEKFRIWIESKSKFFGELFRCPFCLSYWVSALFVLFFLPRPIVSSFLIIDVMCSWFMIVAFSGPVVYVLTRSYWD